MDSSVYAAKQHIFCLLIFSAYAKHNTWVSCAARRQLDTIVMLPRCTTEPIEWMGFKMFSKEQSQPSNTTKTVYYLNSGTIKRRTRTNEDTEGITEQPTST